MKTLVASTITLFLAGSALAQTVDYRFDEVKRSVKVTTPRGQVRVEKGVHAVSGDLVQTGWFSYALLAAEHYRARFEIFSSTDVKLASGQPGVILSLERGRIRAAFDKITGNEPRVVQTPGALLAVRGTKYDVEVDASGRTTVDVWEGTVEVKSKLRTEPFLVHAGEESIFGRSEAPRVGPMPDDRRRNDPEHPQPTGRGGTDREGDHGQGPEHGRVPAPPGVAPGSKPPQTSPPPPHGHD